jgi:hypothetical protein
MARLGCRLFRKGMSSPAPLSKAMDSLGEVSVCEGGGACRKRTNGKMVFLPMLCLAEATWLPLESCNSRLLIPSCHGMEQCNRGFSITFLLFLPLIRHLLIPMEIYADILK